MELKDSLVGQLIEQVSEIREKIGRVEKTAEETLQQAQKTNGSVAELFRRVRDLENEKCKEEGQKDVRAKIFEFFRYLFVAFLGGFFSWLFRKW